MRSTSCWTAVPSEVGIESTIVDLTRETPAILRPGRISAQQIADALPIRLGETARTSARIGIAGLPLCAAAAAEDRACGRDRRLCARSGRTRRSRCLSRRGRPRDSKATLWQVAPELPEDYARLLYGTLRWLDVSGCRMIVVEALPALAGMDGHPGSSGPRRHAGPGRADRRRAALTPYSVRQYCLRLSRRRISSSPSGRVFFTRRLSFHSSAKSRCSRKLIPAVISMAISAPRLANAMSLCASQTSPCVPR